MLWEVYLFVLLVLSFIHLGVFVGKFLYKIIILFYSINFYNRSYNYLNFSFSTPQPWLFHQLFVMNNSIIWIKLIIIWRKENWKSLSLYLHAFTHLLIFISQSKQMLNILHALVSIFWKLNDTYIFIELSLHQFEPFSCLLHQPLCLLSSNTRLT